MYHLHLITLWILGYVLKLFSSMTIRRRKRASLLCRVFFFTHAHTYTSFVTQIQEVILKLHSARPPPQPGLTAISGPCVQNTSSPFQNHFWVIFFNYKHFASLPHLRHLESSNMT